MSLNLHLSRFFMAGTAPSGFWMTGIPIFLVTSSCTLLTTLQHEKQGNKLECRFQNDTEEI